MPLKDHIKPDPYRPPTMEQIERARAMYAEKFTVSRILAHCDMSLGTLYYWLDGGPRSGPPSPSSLTPSGKPGVVGGPPGQAGATLLPPIARRRSVVGKRRKPLHPCRVSLIARLTRTAERQVRDIEQRLAKPSRATAEREREVRMLASLVHMLRGLAGLAPADALAPAQPAAAEEGDIDEFRRVLAARIESFVAAERAEQQARESPTPGLDPGSHEASPRDESHPGSPGRARR